MLLAIDVGNTQLFAGVFIKDQLKLTFRKSSQIQSSSDELGIFLRQVIQEGGLSPDEVNAVVISSVVPEINHALASACIKYFSCRPLLLQAGVKTGLKIRYNNPQEIGSDLIADAVAACQLYPQRDRLIVNLGTANTYCLVNAKDEFIGGIITPGLRVSMQALSGNTAKLPTVAIQKPESLIGKNTIECIQSGLYLSTLAMIKEVTAQVRIDYAFDNLMVIGTGGLSVLFEQAQLFDVVEPDLVLLGLYLVWQLNG